MLDNTNVWDVHKATYIKNNLKIICHITLHFFSGFSSSFLPREYFTNLAKDLLSVFHKVYNHLKGNLHVNCVYFHLVNKDSDPVHSLAFSGRQDTALVIYPITSSVCWVYLWLLSSIRVLTIIKNNNTTKMKINQKLFIECQNQPVALRRWSTVE